MFTLFPGAQRETPAGWSGRPGGQPKRERLEVLVHCLDCGASTEQGQPCPPSPEHAGEAVVLVVNPGAAGRWCVAHLLTADEQVSATSLREIPMNEAPRGPQPVCSECAAELDRP